MSRAVAAILWTKSCHDFNAAADLKDTDPDRVGDQVFGLLLQQSVEKAVKSLMLRKNLRYSHTHDLRKLFQELSRRVEIPPELGYLDELSSFAMQERYEVPVSPYRMDRNGLLRDVRLLLDWVAENG